VEPDFPWLFLSQGFDEVRRLEDMIDVMIIEDDEVATKIYGQFIRKTEGFRVIASTSTGVQTKEVLNVVKPNLVLLDVYLPDINGIELLWEMRKIHRGIDVILITASNDADTVSEAIRGGAFGYMIKPISIDQFVSTLQSYSIAHRKLKHTGEMSQNEVDSLFYKKAAPKLNGIEMNDLPKGIDKITLKNVKDKIRAHAEIINTDELASLIGSSHSTARKYLEYLVFIGELDVKITYGTVGRPERKYKLRYR